MKNRKLNSIVAIVAGTLLLVSCSAKKETQQEPEKMQMAGEKIEEQPQQGVKAFDSVDPSVKTQVNGLLKNYNEMIEALANDDAKNATAAAKTLEDHLTKFDMAKLKDEQMSFYHQQEAKLSEALKQVSKSIDIEGIRTETAIISDGMYALVKAYGGNSVPVYYNYCPMAKNNEGAYWLSQVKEIKNPYMGQSMPTCGTTKEILE